MQLELRGIGPAIIKRYLIDLGGKEIDASTVASDDWRATIAGGAPVSIGALRIGRTIVTLTGEDAALQQVVADLKEKTLRAGG